MTQSGTDADPQVRTVGEQGLLALVQTYCPEEVVGDDGAVVDIPSGQKLVVTTDVLVEGVHFSDQTMSPVDIGWKAAAANLSDLAAMGATPVGITVGLAIPPEQSVSWVEGVYQGLSACLNHFPFLTPPQPIPILGGDICRSSVVSLSITALGSVIPDRVILRSQAQPGDLILTTGIHGASKAGLELLLNPESQLGFSDLEAQWLIQAHQRPQPRLDIATQLYALWRSAAGEQPYGIAGMDSSDGLADALIQIAQASGVGMRIQAAALPMPTCFPGVLSHDQALDWCLFGGEDYQLVLTMPPRVAEVLQNQLPQALWILGEVTADPDVILIDQGESRQLSRSQGFQHFPSR